MMEAKISQGDYTQSVHHCYMALWECFHQTGSPGKMKRMTKRKFQAGQRNNKPSLLEFNM